MAILENRKSCILDFIFHTYFHLLNIDKIFLNSKFKIILLVKDLVLLFLLMIRSDQS